jgi:hypothetical protein
LLAGKVIILAISLPIITNIIEIISGLLPWIFFRRNLDKQRNTF